MFAILENGSVETMLRYRLRFSTGRAFAIPTGQSKTRMTVMTLRSCARTFVAGPTMSIIESLFVLWRLVARAKQSAPSGGNGRRVISVDRPLRLRTAPRERPGCSPASLPPEGTSWPFSRCIGPDGPPVGGVQQLRGSDFAQGGPAELISPPKIFIGLIYGNYGAHEHLGGAFANFGSQVGFLCSDCAESDRIHYYALTSDHVRLMAHACVPSSSIAPACRRFQPQVH